MDGRVARAVSGPKQPLRFAMQGRSMLPLLRAPMVLEVEPLRHRAHVGDVIVVARAGAHVVRRVVRYAGDHYVTSGDANPRVSEETAHADVLGRVEAVWSNASASAYRVDRGAHRAVGRLFACVHPIRRFLASANARTARAAVRRPSLRSKRHA